MPAILATLLVASFALVPTTVPALVPGSVPGSVPSSVTTAPAVVPVSQPGVIPGVNTASPNAPGPITVLVPGTTPGSVPATVNGNPGIIPASVPTFVPAPGVGLVPQPIGPAPSLVPTSTVVAAPGLVPIPAVPTTIPGTVPGSVPGTAPSTIPGVPGVIPAFVPGTVPAVVIPGTPQAPVTLFGGTATGSGCSTCVIGTGTVSTNGATTTWTRACPACPTGIVNLYQPVFTSTGCNALTGTTLNNCCRDSLRPAICGVPTSGRPTVCACNGVTISCPSCNHSKKGLLGLLGLLGLIPLLLCCSLLLCLLWLCCIRGTKKGPDTHFATYAPNAVAMPTVVEHCAPTYCAPQVVEHCAPEIVEHCDYGHGGYGVNTFA